MAGRTRSASSFNPFLFFYVNRHLFMSFCQTNNILTEKITFRASKEEKQSLIDKAKSMKLDLSKYIRKSLGLNNKCKKD